jgi:hypothetical protein
MKMVLLSSILLGMKEILENITLRMVSYTWTRMVRSTDGYDNAVENSVDIDTRTSDGKGNESHSYTVYGIKMAGINAIRVAWMHSGEIFINYGGKMRKFR